MYIASYVCLILAHTHDECYTYSWLSCLLDYTIFTRVPCMLCHMKITLPYYTIFYNSPASLQVQRGFKITNPSLVCNSWNAHVPSGLVRVFTTWNKLGTCWISMCFAITISRTKWISSSMHLVWAWRIRLCEKRTTLSLSYRSAREINDTPSYLIKDFIHSNSYVVCYKARYSALILDIATSGCFLELHETKFGPTKMQEPDVEEDHQNHLPD